MTNTNLLHAMGRIDPKLIADAAPDVDQKKSANISLIKWASLVACLALILSTIIVVSTLRKDELSLGLPTDIDNIIWSTEIGDSPDISIETPLWEGWRVDSYSLYRKLESADPDQYFALHFPKPFGTDLFTTEKP